MDDNIFVKQYEFNNPLIQKIDFMINVLLEIVMIIIFIHLIIYVNMMLILQILVIMKQLI